jgi:hypothetical protein
MDCREGKVGVNCDQTHCCGEVEGALHTNKLDILFLTSGYSSIHDGENHLKVGGKGCIIDSVAILPVE